MKNMIIVSDFDGTITQKDSLYDFFKNHADKDWLRVEELWTKGEINSKECLRLQFDLVKNLSEELVEEYINNIKLDPYFKSFNDFRLQRGLDLIIVSDGVDYFINKILQKNYIQNIEIVSNHGEFKNGKFELEFPNQYQGCVNNAGCCKCKIIRNLKEKYKKIVYIGDGVSDFCVASKVDFLFAKSSLLAYCKKKEINHIEYENFKGVIEHDFI